MKKFKKATTLLLSIIMLSIVFIPKVGIATNVKTAKPNTSKVLVDGVPKSFEAYTIEGNNYFKLRDIAMALNGTASQFEVTWNNEAESIEIFTGKTYTPVGGELIISSNFTNKEAEKTISKIYCDGIELKLTVYKIGNNNYFKLRDLGDLFGYEVTWDNTNKTIGILTGKGETASIIDTFYYINETIDEEFYNNNPASYRIFKYDNGKTQQISTNSAYDLTILGNSIYYMKMDYLAREDGSAQVGSLWKIDLDGSNEKQVLKDNIYTVTSDDKYIYFTGYDFGDNIMRIKPGGKPEVFIKDCKTFKVVYNDGWLYYVKNKDHNIMRINANTKEQQKVVDERADPESGLLFMIYDNTILMPTYDANWQSIVIKVDINTSKETVLPYDKSYLGVSKNGTLYYRDWDKDKIFFTKFK